ncbi:hypothetical protein A0J51_02659 [Gluconobacter japonicus]|nr:hypothetical protein A0J51_02659 [Gluconobacter japonicus]
MFLIRSWRANSSVLAIKKGDPVSLRIALVLTNSLLFSSDAAAQQLSHAA